MIEFVTMNTPFRILVVAALTVSGWSAGAQVPEPAKNEFETIDGIVAALYDCISGPAGQKRDWDRFRSIFAADARMIPVARRQDGSLNHRAMTPEDYVQRSGPLLEERGFFEREIFRKTEQFASIAHVWSTYEARAKAEDVEPMMRGINSIQLFHDGKRWWLLSISWQAEDDENPLPAHYLPG
jgi:hypothetical protein